ncbi:MAG: hypothetical protein GXO78_14315 [Calditrichaeota bacterium]|nr:hypothetical protein [Calditrichota bacterium]
MAKRKGQTFSSWVRILLLAIGVAGWWFPTPGTAQPGQSNHPELRWQTIETEHFLIHYHQGTERTANVVARIAEEVYPHITGLYQYEPPKKVHIIIRDTDDYSNGGAYFFDNKIEIWAENLDYVLRGTHNWLRDVVTHEFTHIVSIQKSLRFSRKIPAGWFQVFGYEEVRRPDVVRGFPDVLVSYPISGVNIPGWFAEGVAQFQSPSRRYDYRDSHREMILRDRVMTGKLLDLKQMSVFGKNSVGNESVYNQGFAFVEFLTAQFGDSIVKDIARLASNPFSLKFNQALEKATGVPADQLWATWKTYLENTYRTRLATILQHPVVGEPVDTLGIGNLYPRVSPDGRYLAYVATGKSDYLSLNHLVILDLKTGKKKRVSSRITSSLSWSPDGRYLVYSRKVKVQPNGSRFNDLYVYDVQNDREIQITDALRARNPDWSHDGRRLVFVVGADGLANLYTLEWERLESLLQEKSWKTLYYHLTEHRVVEALPEDAGKDWQLNYRKARIRGGQLRQITRWMNGRQFYHPRWSPDDRYIFVDTSIGFGRDIVRVDPQTGEMTPVLNSVCDERYPTFHPGTGELFYACDETGIFNIYSLDLNTGEKHAHTNVVGGAFMPTISPEGDMYYSLYRHQGYKIFQVPQVNAVPMEYLTYDADYESKIPRLQVDDRLTNALPASTYRRQFPGFFMPRLFFDYGTFKPGFYFVTDDILSKLSFLGGAAVNRYWEYDIYAFFDLKLWKPTVSVGVYNITRKIQDKFSDPFYVTGDSIEIKFDLLEAEFTVRHHLWNKVDWRLSYIFRQYKARIGTFAVKELATNRVFVVPPVRYTYLKGHIISLWLRYKRLPLNLESDINPVKGRYITLRINREWNRFLEDFATDRAVGLEIFKPVNFTRFELDWEEYLPVPFLKYHTLDLRMQLGYIDRPVDSFFYFFAGGLVGLKGYPYYSIEGRTMVIGTAIYRFPISRQMNLEIGQVHFNKLYLGALFQYGNAWTGRSIPWKDFRSNVGIQLRLDAFSWYLFPTRVFFEAVYPLQEHEYRGVRYPRKWKYYLGVLFDFDLRFDRKGFMPWVR